MTVAAKYEYSDVYEDLAEILILSCMYWQAWV